MNHCFWLRGGLLAGFALAVAAVLVPWARAAEPLPDLRVAPRPMPEFSANAPEAWINSAPLRLADLKGQVVLIEVWTTA